MVIKQLVNSITNYGIPEEISFNDKKRIRIVNQVLFISGIIPVLYIIPLFFMDMYDIVYFELLIMVTSIGAYQLKEPYKGTIGKFVLLVIIPLELMYFPLFVGDLGEEYFYFTFLILGAYCIDRQLFLIMHIIYITIIIFSAKYLIFHMSYPEKYQIWVDKSYYFNIVVSVLLVVLAAFIFKYDTITYQTTIEAQTQELNNKVLELEDREKLAKKLLRELNHRVKNNLQMISSLFTLQLYNYKNQEIVQALNSVRFRVDAIGILHQYLYNKDHALEPNLKKYIDELSKYILIATGMEERVKLDSFVEDINLGIETTTHIGLIVNELLTNSFKYAVIKNSDNKVELKVMKEADRIIIIVNDTGFGFSRSGFEKKGNTFGLDLIQTMAQQYNGSIDITNSNGAQVKVTLNIN